MFKLVVASGKGGTGKTTVAVNLALAVPAKNVQFLDCDVEEPNAHLFLKPKITESRDVGIPVPSIDRESCTYCGRCAEVCAYNALAVFPGNVMVLPELCHGCGSCSYICPEKAISERLRPVGRMESGNVRRILFGQGILNPGEALSPPLIKAVKQLSRPDYFSIVDAPPGTSCPVVAAVSGCNYCLLVTEPTPFGLHDLDLAYRMTTKLSVPVGVVINRCDLGDSGVEKYCRDHHLPVLLQLPLDLEVARLYARGEPAVKHLPAWKARFEELYTRLAGIFGGGGKY